MHTVRALSRLAADHGKVLRYLPDYLTRFVYQFNIWDRVRAEQLVNEVVVMARQKNPNAPDPRVVLSPRVGKNAVEMPFRNTMYIGTELLRQLNDEECRAVIAHELGHGAQKGRVAAIPITMVACQVVLPAAALVAGFILVGPLAIPAAIAVSMAGRLVSNAVSRSAERHADIYAGQVTQKPAALAHALTTLLPDQVEPPRTFLRRVTARSKELTMDHPAPYRRVQYLQAMQRQIDNGGLSGA